MDLRLDISFSLLTGIGELAVLIRLLALEAMLRYWYFSLYLLCGSMQCLVWLLGTPTSFAYATFWLCTTPLMIGLRIAVVAESWMEDRRLAKPTVVATIMSNLGLERHLKGLGIALARTPVGDRYVLEHMREGGFNLGGEPSGHIIMSDYATTGDGFVAALQVLAVVKKHGKPVSEVCHRFDPLPQVTRNVRYRAGKPHEHKKVKSAIADAEKRLNGHGRLIVRPSGTEPVVRVTGEGEDLTLVEEVVDGIVDALNQAAAT